MSYEGVVPPLVSPADRSGDVKTDVLAEYTQSLVERDVHGLMPCGTTGEFSSCSREQRERILDTVADLAGDTTVYAGCGGTSTGSVLSYIRDADAAGADVAVVVAPYYSESSNASLRRYLERIADASPLPLILYNIPARTGRNLPLSLVVDLAAHGNVVGIKDSSGDLRYLYSVLEQTPASFVVMQGIPELAIPSLHAGCDGVVAGIANVFPDPLVTLYEECRDANFERALEINRHVVEPLTRSLRDVPGPVGIKYLLELAGYDVGDPLLPHPTLDGPQKTALEDAFRSVLDAEVGQVDAN